MAVNCPQIKLNDGNTMPALGFGTFASVGHVGETHRAVLAALEAGYRHLDCAWFYLNEHEVGSAVQEFLSHHPEVTRTDLFIATKVWQHLHDPKDVEWSINSSLEKLGLDYIDLFLIHWPFAAERTEDYFVKIGDDGKVILLLHPHLR
jgi:diketogulonate reductase-like aldo/keto reductase